MRPAEGERSQFRDRRCRPHRTRGHSKFNLEDDAQAADRDVQRLADDLPAIRAEQLDGVVHRLDQPVRFAAVLGQYYDIGWRLIRSAWGHGYATEAASAALADAFERLSVALPHRSMRRSTRLTRDWSGAKDQMVMTSTSPSRAEKSSGFRV